MIGNRSGWSHAHLLRSVLPTLLDAPCEMSKHKNRHQVPGVLIVSGVLFLLKLRGRNTSATMILFRLFARLKNADSDMYVPTRPHRFVYSLDLMSFPRESQPCDPGPALRGQDHRTYCHHLDCQTSRGRTCASMALKRKPFTSKSRASPPGVILPSRPRYFAARRVCPCPSCVRGDSLVTSCFDGCERRSSHLDCGEPGASCSQTFFVDCAPGYLPCRRVWYVRIGKRWVL